MGKADAHTALPHKMTEGLKQPSEAGNHSIIYKVLMFWQKTWTDPVQIDCSLRSKPCLEQDCLFLYIFTLWFLSWLCLFIAIVKGRYHNLKKKRGEVGISFSSALYSGKLRHGEVLEVCEWKKPVKQWKIWKEGPGLPRHGTGRCSPCTRITGEQPEGSSLDGVCPHTSAAHRS